MPKGERIWELISVPLLTFFLPLTTSSLLFFRWVPPFIHRHWLLQPLGGHFRCQEREKKNKNQEKKTSWAAKDFFCAHSSNFIWQWTFCKVCLLHPEPTVNLTKRHITRLASRLWPGGQPNWRHQRQMSKKVWQQKQKWHQPSGRGRNRIRRGDGFSQQEGESLKTKSGSFWLTAGTKMALGAICLLMLLFTQMTAMTTDTKRSVSITAMQLLRQSWKIIIWRLGGCCRALRAAASISRGRATATRICSWWTRTGRLSCAPTSI